VDPVASPSFVTIARIVRPRGKRGEVVADSYTDFPERFSLLQEVWLDFAGRSRIRIALESVWEHKGRPVLKFAGIDSISAAETLVGAWVQVEAADSVPLPEGTYFDHELTGCTVVDLSGHELGTVFDVLRLSGNHQLVVRGAAGEFMIPATEAICREISIADKRIVVDLPAGLMDLNE
jgi:16S rRNA processing protein RimM